MYFLFHVVNGYSCARTPVLSMMAFKYNTLMKNMKCDSLFSMTFSLDV